MKVAITRFAARFEPPDPPGTDPRSPERLEAEISARDGYIQNLAARNLLLRMQVQELKAEVKRLRAKRDPLTS